MSEGSNNNEFPQGHGSDSGGLGDLGTARPAVASAPKKMLVFIILGIVFVLIVVKSLFFSSGSSAPPPVKRPEKVASVSSGPIPPSALPQPPTPFTPIQVPAPPPPPPLQVAPPAPQISAKSGPDNQKLQARVHSPMLSGGGSGGGAPASQKKKGSMYVGSDSNTAFAQSVEETSAETIGVTKVSNLDHTIIQGKIIEGVLETAIDSTLPGEIRAIVSHDTYAESGRSILIPKGSRVIGLYNAAVRRGQARVYIIWKRVVRPDGIDIAINSPGVDSLGRAGMEGDVDNKYFEAFSTAIFSSTLDIGLAALGDALFGNQQQTTTTGAGGGTTTTSSPTSTAMQTAVQNLGDVGKSIVGSTLNLQPTIYIDQGQRLNIMVNKDIVFPYGINGEMEFIP